MVSDVLNYFPNLLRFHNSNELEVKLELQSRNANNHQETLLFLNRKRAPFALSLNEPVALRRERGEGRGRTRRASLRRVCGEDTGKEGA